MGDYTQHGDSTDRVLSVTKIIPRKGLWPDVPLSIGGLRSIRQAAAAPGVIEAVAGRAKGSHWAVVIGEGAASRNAYVRSGAHGKAAVKARSLARSHISCHIPWESDELPHWSEWERLLAIQPRVIDTRHANGLTDEQRFEGPGRSVFPRGRAGGRP
jgi:hypothetical protein